MLELLAVPHNWIAQVQTDLHTCDGCDVTTLEARCAQVLTVYPQLLQGPTINLSLQFILSVSAICLWSLEQSLGHYTTLQITWKAGSYLAGKPQYVTTEKASFSHKRYHLLTTLLGGFLLAHCEPKPLTASFATSIPYEHMSLNKRFCY